MRDIVYFDLETRHSAAEVGGWHNTAEMRLSVGVTYSTASGKYTIYSEEMVDDLIRQLSQADLVVGYNHEHFDYGVLVCAYSAHHLRAWVPTAVFEEPMEAAATESSLTRTPPRCSMSLHKSRLFVISIMFHIV